MKPFLPPVPSYNGMSCQSIVIHMEDTEGEEAEKGGKRVFLLHLYTLGTFTTLNPTFVPSCSLDIFLAIAKTKKVSSTTVNQ